MSVKKIDDSSLVAIADALRSATTTIAPIAFPDGFVSAIESIASEGSGSGGVQMLIGTQTIEFDTEAEDGEMIMVVNDVPFTADGAIVWHTASYSTHYYVRGEQTLLFAVGSPVSAGTTGLCYDYGLTGFKGNAYTGMQIFQNGSTVRLFADAYYNGPYKYVIWGH